MMEFELKFLFSSAFSFGDIITHHINPQDFLNCLLVCKTWKSDLDQARYLKYTARYLKTIQLIDKCTNSYHPKEKDTTPELWRQIVIKSKQKSDQTFAVLLLNYFQRFQNANPHWLLTPDPLDILEIAVATNDVVFSTTFINLWIKAKSSLIESKLNLLQRIFATATKFGLKSERWQAFGFLLQNVSLRMIRIFEAQKPSDLQSQILLIIFDSPKIQTNHEITKHFIDKVAFQDLMPVNENRSSALHLAISKRNFDTVELLVNKLPQDAWIRSQEKMEWNPFYNKRVKSVKTESALDLALDSCHWTIIELFINKILQDGTFEEPEAVKFLKSAYKRAAACGKEHVVITLEAHLPLSFKALWI